MLRGQRPTVNGQWYQTESAMNEPRIRDDLPILIGGSGEKKTFGLAARYASHLNIICDPAELPKKLAALDERCRKVGRDRAEIETSFLASVALGKDRDSALQAQSEALQQRGVATGQIDPERLRAMMSRMFAGPPDEVAADVKRRVLNAGVDGVIINMPADGDVPGQVQQAGEALSALVS